MNVYNNLPELLSDAGLSCIKNLIQDNIDQRLTKKYSSDWPKWELVINGLQKYGSMPLKVMNNKLMLGAKFKNSTERQNISDLLKQLSPWRKGPIWIHGIHVDTEWRSDYKWNRVLPYISNLKDRVVLDVGSGNGYYCFRMAKEGAALALGIEPYIRSVAQFNVMRFAGGKSKAIVVPLRVEDLPSELPLFDTVFSMGLLYHRRSPLDHLLQLKKLLKPGGELVLETLVIDGDETSVLVPSDRYAMMRNVWFIPSPDSLVRWTKRVGFKNAKIVDISVTTTDEQRKTEWMQFDSLVDFLDPNDHSKTIEGYPAPQRAVLIAKKAM